VIAVSKDVYMLGDDSKKDWYPELTVTFKFEEDTSVDEAVAKVTKIISNGKRLKSGPNILAHNFDIYTFKPEPV